LDAARKLEGFFLLGENAGIGIFDVTDIVIFIWLVVHVRKNAGQGIVGGGILK